LGKYLAAKISGKMINCVAGGSARNGACASFIGRVRADRVGKRTVRMIEYSSYDGMAEKTMARIGQDIVRKYKLRKLVMKHSVGKVPAGEVAILVCAEAGHRKEAIRAMDEAVERIKKEVPIWKKEIFKDGSHRWI
jgi:molybdopterin synthase catalytic subunit